MSEIDDFIESLRVEATTSKWVSPTEEPLVWQAADRLAAMRDRIKVLEAALEPFAIYSEKRDAMPLKGCGDAVSIIHPGTDYAAEITLTDCRRARAALSKGEENV